MEYKSLTRLEQIYEKNKNNSQWLNKDLYRFLYKKDMYISAYEKIKQNKGALTKGTTQETLDGFSLKRVENVISTMRDNKFEFNPARRIYIPKVSGGQRPLGIPNATDKIVQEVIRMILEAIYEPVFLTNSHGFRPNRSCHSALLQVKQQFNGIKWVVEGDIQGAYDTIDHTILLKLLKRKIQDERFIQIIQKALKAGYLDQSSPVTSLIGTPQGSIVSPILANIYFHELDVFIETLQTKYQTKVEDVRRRTTTKYNELRTLITQEEQAIKNCTDPIERKTIAQRIKRVKRQRTMVKAYETESIPILIRYVRYADDWIVGINGPKKIAIEIKDEIATFLNSKLMLKLSPEKTKLTYLKNEKALFLGYDIHINSTVKVAKLLTPSNKVVYKRTTGNLIQLNAPIDRIISRLCIKGFCDGKGNPISKRSWTVQSDEIIVQAFNRVLIGILNYYSGAENQRKLIRIQFILQHSCACTLAHKHKSTVAKIYAKHGSAMEVKYKILATNKLDTTDKPDTRKMDATSSTTISPFTMSESPTTNNSGITTPQENDSQGRQETKVVSTGDSQIVRYKSVRLQLRKFNKSQIKWFVKQKFYDPFKVYINRRVRSKLAENCCICGIDVDVEIHNIKHVKSPESGKGFSQIMGLINRKQIPVCRDCHMSIHAGKYDGLKLSNFSLPNLAKK
jgi:group II intron reverse transcriptase/maturase